MRTFGFHLSINPWPSANLVEQEELPSVFILSWTLLSNHAKLLRLIFSTIKEQEKSEPSCKNFKASYSEGTRTSKRIVWRKWACGWTCQSVLGSMCPENWERKISGSLWKKSSLDKMGVMPLEFKHQGNHQCSVISTQRKMSNDQTALYLSWCEGSTEIFKKGCLTTNVNLTNSLHTRSQTTLHK